VDLYCDKKLFAAFQGSEFIHIINNAYKRYSIDFTKLFHYAKRRRKEIELVAFFSDKTDIPNSILND
jgi:7-cyano-7-deazaguanine synthase in queuosine biosynthesis